MTEKYKHLIPLGCNCVLADQLKKNHLRKAAYPLDWCNISLEALCSILENNFAHFFDENSINQKNKILTNNTGNEEAMVKSLVYKGLTFRHEWEIINDRKKGFGKVKDKYERRVKRFYAAVNSKEPILFIRFIYKGSNEDVIQLNNTLHKKFPNLKYSLLLIKDMENKSKSRKISPSSSKMQKYYIDTPQNDSYFNNIKYDLSWSMLFQKMGLINKHECLFFTTINIIHQILKRTGSFIKNRIIE